MVFYFGVLGLYIIFGIIINFSFENKAARLFQSLSMIVILRGFLLQEQQALVLTLNCITTYIVGILKREIGKIF